MQENKTIARPYAAAAFEFALEQSQIAQWSEFLTTAAFIVHDERVKRLLSNPDVTPEQGAEFLMDILKDILSESQRNFLNVLVVYDRLLVIPYISELFEQHRKEHANVVAVDVISAFEMSDAQKEKFSKALKIRLQKAVNLTFSTDKSLVGGAIVRAGDFVIDGSVRGQLDRLKLALEA